MGLDARIYEAFNKCKYCERVMAITCKNVNEAVCCKNAVTHASISCEEPIKNLIIENTIIAPTPCQIYNLREYYNKRPSRRNHD